MQRSQAGSVLLRLATSDPGELRFLAGIRLPRGLKLAKSRLKPAQ